MSFLLLLLLLFEHQNQICVNKIVRNAIMVLWMKIALKFLSSIVYSMILHQKQSFVDLRSHRLTNTPLVWYVFVHSLT